MFSVTFGLLKSPAVDVEEEEESRRGRRREGGIESATADFMELGRPATTPGSCHTGLDWDTGMNMSFLIDCGVATAPSTVFWAKLDVAIGGNDGGR